MTLQGFYLASWIALLGLGMILSFLSSLTWPLHLGLSGFASLWALVGGWRRWRRYRPSPWGVSLVGFGLALVGALLAYDDKDLVAGLSAALWSVLPGFLFRGQRPYGHWLGLMTIAAIALISVMIREELLPFSLFLVFIVVLVLNLNATNLLQLAGAQGARRYRLPQGYLQGLVPAFFWGAVTAALIFFLFPRTGNWTNPLALRGQESTTGYKGTVNLESSTRIREEERVEMQVVSPDPVWLAARFNSLYFRGNTVEVFDGTHWTPFEREWDPVFPNTDLRYTHGHTARSQNLEIFREQHQDRAVFYPGVLTMVRVPWRLTRGLLTDFQGNLRRFRTGSLRYSYEVQVAEALPAPSISWGELRRKVRSWKPDPAHLSVPQSVSQAAYWKQWVGELETQRWKALPLKEVFLDINRHFQTNYSPTLVHDFPEALPLEGFLKNRKGHCEYFATAAALLLRSQGIPTRMVLGFRGGTYNDVSQTMEVRAKHAHAWLEVQTGPHHWTVLDPTPVILGGSSGGWRERWTLYSHAVAFWFNRYVVQYNVDTQRQLLRSFANFGRQSRDRISWTVAGRNLGVLVLLVLLLWGARRWIPRWRPSSDPLPDYYREFLKWAQGRGWSRRAGESRHAFHRRIADQVEKKSAIESVDAGLHRDRYSPHPHSPEERERLKGIVRDLG